MHITVREARISELDAAGALTAAVYRDDALAEPSYLPRLADAAARHRAEGATQLVAVDPQGVIVGAIVYVIADTEYADLATGDEAEIRMLATSPAARGQGVGEALVRACVDLARAQRRPRLVLSSKPIMTTAHRLYDRIGFVRSPERDWEFAPGKGLLTFEMPLNVETPLTHETTLEFETPLDSEMPLG
jgi:ribosomal protein S18 acetylase RimI-like enzyme